MSTTILDALLNCQYNFKTLGSMGLSGNPIYIIGMSQLSNAIEALENGRDADFIIQESLVDEVKK